MATREQREIFRAMSAIEPLRLNGEPTKEYFEMVESLAVDAWLDTVHKLPEKSFSKLYKIIQEVRS